MADKLVADLVKYYRAGKKVQKALRVVKRPTVLGLLGIALGASGRAASRESATSRKQVGEKDKAPVGTKAAVRSTGEKSQASLEAGGEKSAQGV